MDQTVTGAMIRTLRRKQGLTQVELAGRLFISDKTISKWERGRGTPDVALWEPLARALGVSPGELMGGRPVENINLSANMLRSRFYVCPVCANVIHAVGEAAIHCHGVPLAPQKAGETDESHGASVSEVEDELLLEISHPMTKKHYIVFAAALYPDGLQMQRLYPEGAAMARFRRRGLRSLYFYCIRDGLFVLPVNKGLLKGKNP